MRSKGLYFYPRTKLGKVSIWLVVVPFLLIFANVLMSSVLKIDIPLSGFIFMMILIAGGVTSFISIVRNKDLAISLIITSLLGLLGVLFVIGEFVFPH